MTHEFVSPDYFQNITGDATGEASIFMTSTYGPFGDPWQAASGTYNYALAFVGSQPGGAGAPFVPQRSFAVDWSPFAPHATTPGGLDVATGWGPTQFGCCPKTVVDTMTVGGLPRRVLLGWLQNGCSSPGGHPGSDVRENSLTLPREISLGPDGSMRQRFVSELQQLRVGKPFHTQGGPLPSGRQPLAFAGAQLEIAATLGFPTGSDAVFGLAVLSGPSEYTDIVINLGLQQVWIDRRKSSADGSDADVRAGPMPPSLAKQGEVSLHAYVDHSIVTVIVENQTALTAWVHPTSPNSTGIALFTRDMGGSRSASSPPVLISLDAWQLADAS